MGISWVILTFWYTAVKIGLLFFLNLFNIYKFINYLISLLEILRHSYILTQEFSLKHLLLHNYEISGWLSTFSAQYCSSCGAWWQSDPVLVLIQVLLCNNISTFWPLGEPFAFFLPFGYINITDTAGICSPTSKAEDERLIQVILESIFSGVVFIYKMKDAVHWSPSVQSRIDFWSFAYCADGIHQSVCS